MLPRIFFNDWFPLTAALGSLLEAEEGSSGKADFDMIDGAGALLVRVAGPGTDVGPRMTGAGAELAAAAEADTHGVLRCGWRKPLAAGAIAVA